MDKTRQVFENPSGFKIQNQRSLEALQDPLGPAYPLLQRCAKQQGEQPKNPAHCFRLLSKQPIFVFV